MERAAHYADQRSFSVIVLAAGMPTALAPVRGRTVVEHAARAALASGALEVLVVAGSNDGLARRLRHLPVRVLRCSEANPQLSMAIRLGISGVSTQSAGVVIARCDQICVTPAHLRALGSRIATPGTVPVIASQYGTVRGAPCAFSREVFSELAHLEGPEGARRLVRNGPHLVEIIVFESADVREFVADVQVGPIIFRSAGIPFRGFLSDHKARAPPGSTARTPFAP